MTFYDMGGTSFVKQLALLIFHICRAMIKGINYFPYLILYPKGQGFSKFGGQWFSEVNDNHGVQTID